MQLRLGLLILVLSPASAALSMPASTDTTYIRARTVEPQQPLLREPVHPVEWAAQAFGHCVAGGMRAVDATADADAGAASLMNICAAQLQAVQREAERVIAAAHWTEARKDIARAELQARFVQVEQRLSARIRQARLRSASSR